jgi:phosphoserine aminotransferase
MQERLKKRQAASFSPAPGVLPAAVLSQLHSDLVQYGDSPFGLCELHQSSKYHRELEQLLLQDLRSFLEVPDEFEIHLLTGGAQLVNSILPLSLIRDDNECAEYIHSGYWSRLTMKELDRHGLKYTEHDCFDLASKPLGLHPAYPETAHLPNPQYFYYCDNETLVGMEFPSPPQSERLLVGDMTSNFMSKPLDYSKYALIFAGSSKCIGIIGITFLIVRKSILESSSESPPHHLCLKQLCREPANKPTVLALRASHLCLRHFMALGDIRKLDEIARRRIQLIYAVLDDSKGFYTTLVQPAYRSRMNVVFSIRGGEEELERALVSRFNEKGLLGIQPNAKPIGNVRISMYNGMTEEGAARVAEVLRLFMEEHQTE